MMGTGTLSARRLTGWIVLVAALLLPGLAQALEVKHPGVLRVAVYKEFAPFSDQDSGGIDVDIARALADKLGLKLDLAWAEADEKVEDDLRNYVWKGHYMGNEIADLMLHMPVDPVFNERVKQVKLIAPYYAENLMVARDTKRIPKLENLEPFFQNHDIGVEVGGGSDTFLMALYAGRMRDHIKHFKNHEQAIAALRKGEVSAVMGPRTELEGLLGADKSGYSVNAIEMTGPVLSFWQPGVAVKADKPQLIEAIKQAVDGMVASGQMAEIFAKHHARYNAPRVEGAPH
ncbi:MAG: amino acid ABC transporter substrate-binding protein [Betaproteobacteria bacterium]|jgi:ABC-type amino acid transport substrate-binding protein|nr:amino acid ABC transporter substrate-binding protein [Betaproteobacteria bacterium]NBS92931.1 amino acid ABC transporter substrate-binding protein [Betaproteobacteria bacterium]NBY53323.1 amino acid ABC transporter substrate-binding protein [Betaproteobacteria bacterium]NCA23506.1 amino acid ABC transporter substrate-binding protein [Betaproteobacteria bacterium]NDF70247.1 amino acid ABC transporter substrate-binding protein [Betaproteobacteria bacterium]